MIKIIVEYKNPVIKVTGSNTIYAEQIMRDEHEVEDLESSVAFREGTLIIFEKNGKIAGYSVHNYIRFWSVEVKE